MNRFQIWMQRVFAGRNGSDELARVWSMAGCLLLFVSLFLPAGIVQVLIWIAGFWGVGLSWFRIFSRNIYKRGLENQRYLQWRNTQQQRFRQWKTRYRQRKEYRFFRCEKCKTLARVPRGRGKICITCPHCGFEFIRKS